MYPQFRRGDPPNRQFYREPGIDTVVQQANTTSQIYSQPFIQRIVFFLRLVVYCICGRESQYKFPMETW